MATSRNHNSFGHEEDSEDLKDVCAFCVELDRTTCSHQAAMHFCYDCGPFGRYICGVCVKHHNMHKRGHCVVQISKGQPPLRRNAPELSAANKNPLDELQTKLGEKEQKLQNVTEQLQISHGKVKELTEELHYMTQRFEELSSAIHDDEVDGAGVCIDAVCEQTSIAEDSNTDAQLQHHVEIRNATEHATADKNSVAELQTELSEKEQKLQTVTEQLHISHGKVKELTEELQNMTQRFEELSSAIHSDEVDGAGVCIDAVCKQNTISEDSNTDAQRKHHVEIFENLSASIPYDEIGGKGISLSPERPSSEDCSSCAPRHVEIETPKRMPVSASILHQTIEKKNDSHLAVAAIMVGPTYSSASVLFREQYNLDQWDKMFGDIGGEQQTAVLFDDNGKFKHFGFDAITVHANLLEDNHHQNWYYFSRLPHGIFESKITSDLYIKDDNGRFMKAIDVYTAIVRYLKDWTISNFQKGILDLKQYDVKVVLVIPEVTVNLKRSWIQFMRQVAYKVCKI